MVTRGRLLDDQFESRPSVRGWTLNGTRWRTALSLSQGQGQDKEGDSNLAPSKRLEQFLRYFDEIDGNGVRGGRKTTGNQLELASTRSDPPTSLIKGVAE